jgi:UDP-N-acetylglucosamine:LPS N-acetylglucosamine transferase
MPALGNKVTPVPKKKILILSCTGGYGHRSADATLSEVLAHHEVKVNYPMETTLAPSLDLNFFGLKMVGVQLYDWLLHKNYLRLANFFSAQCAPTFMKMRYASMERRFNKLFEDEKPDLVISVVGFINKPASLACKKLGIPYLYVTLDCDLTPWQPGIESMPFGPTCKMTVVEKTPRICMQLRAKNVPMECIEESGYPVRNSFFKIRNPVLIKRAHKIPVEKPIILLMMGGNGSVSLLNFVEEFARLNMPVHLMICIGRSENLRQPIKELMRDAANTTFTIVPFTKNIPQLMSIADLFISKPGPNSCYEGIFSKVPIIIDRTTACLIWEKGTVELVQREGYGEPLRKMKHLKRTIEKWLPRKKTLCLYDNAITRKRFGYEVAKLAEQMLVMPREPLVIETPNSNVIEPA